MKYNEILNKEQYEAVTCIHGPLLILAGAGSGKTTVLTYRTSFMIQNANIPYYNILAITFTNKAAQEMKTRIINLIGQEASGMWISTFHSTCVRILRREADKLGYNKNFTIYDSYDSKSLITKCMGELNIDQEYIKVKEVINKISKNKDNFINPEMYLIQAEKDFREKKIADIYDLYQKRLKEYNAMDFDDLIFMTVKLFKKDEEVLEFYRRKFKYIMVDEYQDTNKTQYEFVHLLAKEHKNICAVGDDDQCIYEWRGADISNILDFEKDYEDCKVIKLETNYRSFKNILDAANSVIEYNIQRKGKELKTDKAPGDKIKYYTAFSEEDEAKFIISEIEKLTKDKKKSYKDFAVLYRTNAQSRIFESAMVKWGMPYKVVGGLKFYDRKEIKDVLAYLKVIANPLDNLSITRIINVPKRGIGDTTVKKIADYAEYIEENIYPALL
ncbi:MAG: UvrD-helicase domain-containing protein, partial [Oscillospiraceae bacterium]|nr:UvrD-helicase domain-containing protein [Oscillospiraceae bacterium]